MIGNILEELLGRGRAATRLMRDGHFRIDEITGRPIWDNTRRPFDGRRVAVVIVASSGQPHFVRIGVYHLNDGVWSDSGKTKLCRWSAVSHWTYVDRHDVVAGTASAFKWNPP